MTHEGGKGNLIPVNQTRPPAGNYRRAQCENIDISKMSQIIQHMQFSNIVRQWFAQTGGGTLLLPDGWYGRPYDNIHQLTSVEEGAQSFTLVLDNRLSLHFEGLKAIDPRAKELVLGPFDHLRFEYRGIGVDESMRVTEYRSGEVKVVTLYG